MTTTHYTNLDTSRTIYKAVPGLSVTNAYIHNPIRDEWIAVTGWSTEDCDDIPRLTLHDTLRAIEKLGKMKEWDKPIWKCHNYNPRADEPGESGCSSLYCSHAGWRDVKELSQSLLDAFLASGMDMSSPQVSEFLINLFKDHA